MTGNRPAVVSDFVTRDQLEELQKIIRDPGSTTLPSLYGMRGVGKSQLASALAQSCELSGWSLVVWINAATRLQVIDELASLASTLRVAQVDATPASNAQAAVSWIDCNPNPFHLLVYDNVENVDDIGGLVPRAGSAKVVITTTRAAGDADSGIHVDAFSPHDAAHYLMARTRLNDLEAARLLGQDLGYLPLALTQAATAIALGKYTFAGFRDVLGAATLATHLDREAGDPYPHAVHIALNLAVEAALSRIGQRDPVSLPVAQGVLGAMSMLAAVGVPRSWLYGIGDDEGRARRVVGQLVNYSILHESEDGSMVSLHRLQARVIREWSDDEQILDYCKAAVLLLRQVDPLEQDDLASKQAATVQFVSQLATLLDQDYSTQLVEQQDFVAVVLSAQRAANMINPYLGAALASYLRVFARTLGDHHLDTAACMNGLAVTYAHTGQLTDAAALFESVLKIRTEALGPTHQHTLDAKESLGSCHLRSGDFKRGFEKIEEVAIVSAQTYGAHSRAALASRRALAVARMMYAKDYDTAVRELQILSTEAEAALGTDDMETIGIQYDLAGAYIMVGDLSSGLPLREAVARARETRLGAVHPETIEARAALARDYLLAGQRDRAIRYGREVYNAASTALGVDHPVMVKIRDVLAQAYLCSLQPTDAIRLLRENLEAHERHLGSSDGTTIRARDQLAMANFAAGLIEDGLDLLQVSQEARQDAIGADEEYVNLVAAVTAFASDAVAVHRGEDPGPAGANASMQAFSEFLQDLREAFPPSYRDLLADFMGRAFPDAQLGGSEPLVPVAFGDRHISWERQRELARAVVGPLSGEDGRLAGMPTLARWIRKLRRWRRST